jgi:hypothetical protein
MDRLLDLADQQPAGDADDSILFGLYAVADQLLEADQPNGAGDRELVFRIAEFNEPKASALSDQRISL